MATTSRRDDILAAAARVFRERGYADASLQEIAEAVGIRKASLYYFFPSKEQLLAEVLRRPLRHSLERFQGIRDSGLSPAEQVRREIDGLIANYDLFPDEMYVFGHERLDGASAKLREEIARGRRQYNELWEQLLAEAVVTGQMRPDLDPRVVANGIIGMINWMHRWYQPEGKLSGRQIAATFAEMVWSGLERGGGPLPPTPSPRGEGEFLTPSPAGSGRG